MNNQSVSVFVDDYVTGRLPGVCVVTGEPTADRLRLRTTIDGPSGAWLLLLLLGPLGWLVLAFLGVFARRSFLTGTLPMSETAHLELRSKRRVAGVAAIAGFALLITGLAGFAGPVTGFVALAGIILILGGLIRFGVTDHGYPKVALDGSRRWVTVSRVHPDFSAAVRADAAASVEHRP